MSKSDMDRSHDLEAEIGSDAAAYVEGDELAEELLDEDVFGFDDVLEEDTECIDCGAPLDRFGACPDCDFYALHDRAERLRRGDED